MKYKNFEDVPAKVFGVTEDSAFRGRGDIANQIQRAALSVPNNIAEGFERGTTPELIQFLYSAKGSAGEVRFICHVIERIAAFDHLKSKMSNLRSAARIVSRQLGGWLFSLQESDIRGTRHLTEKSKSVYHQKGKAQAFMDELKEQHAAQLEQMLRERRAE